jgi:hypothetical protein
LTEAIWNDTLTVNRNALAFKEGIMKLNGGSLAGFIRALKVLTAFGVIVARCGSSVAMDGDVVSPFFPASSRTIIREGCAAWDEVCVANDALKKSLNEKNPEKAYRLLKIALCGPGESEFSKLFTELVTDNEDKFCESDEQFVGSFYEVQEKCRHRILDLDFDLIHDCAINRCVSALSIELSRLAHSISSAGNMKEAIVMQKKAVFWMLFKVKKNGRLDEYVCKELRKLKEMQNVTKHVG